MTHKEMQERAITLQAELRPLAEPLYRAVKKREGLAVVLVFTDWGGMFVFGTQEQDVTGRLVAEAAKLLNGRPPTMEMRHERVEEKP